MIRKAGWHKALVTGVLMWSLWPVAADASLHEAMKAVRDDQWDAARAEARKESDVALAIVEWRRLRAGEGEFSDYLDFLRDYPHWPGIPFMRRKGEPIIPAAASSDDILMFFEGQGPQSGAGAMRMAAALRSKDRDAEAQELVIKAWRTMSFDADGESSFLAEYGKILGEHHVARLDWLLWEGKLSEAERMRYRVPEGHRALLDARAGLRRDAPGVDVLISRVPPELREDAGLAWERNEWRARRSRTDAVVELIMERSATADLLGRPDKWAPAPPRTRPPAHAVRTLARSLSCCCRTPSDRGICLCRSGMAFGLHRASEAR